jgi:DNA-binding GntR family transcriptional regulator
MSHRYLLSVKVASKLDSRRAEHALILAACIEHDPERAALLLHDHLVTTANDVSLAMGGKQLFELRGAF